MPLWDEPDNLESITLLDGSGAVVPVQFAVDGRHLEVTPEAALQPNAAYTLSFGEALESFSETTLFAAQDLAFTTAAAPSMGLEGSVMLEVDTPSLDIVAGEWNTVDTTLVRLPVEATAGASVSLFVFSPTTLFHRVHMTKAGVWEQQGGLWGKSDRSGPILQLTTFRSRLNRELRRISVPRGLPSP